MHPLRKLQKKFLHYWLGYWPAHYWRSFFCSFPKGVHLSYAYVKVHFINSGVSISRNRICSLHWSSSNKITYILMLWVSIYKIILKAEFKTKQYAHFILDWKFDILVKVLFFQLKKMIVLTGQPKKKRQGGITRKVMEARRLENIGPHQELLWSS